MASASPGPGLHPSPTWVDPTLLAEVQRHGPFDSSCLNCGGCSIVCDLNQGDVTFPRKPIRTVVLGLREAALGGLEPWLCHDCGDCSAACPREADPAGSMRTLRRFLTGQYDGTGLSTRILRSTAWHVGSLLGAAGLVFALFLLYHLHWGGLAAADLVGTSLGLEHMFPKVQYLTWIVYAFPALVLLDHAVRMCRLTLGGERLGLRPFLAEAGTLLLHLVAQPRLRRCEADPWSSSPKGDEIPRRWLKHGLMALGTAMMVVLTGAFLPWFQTDTVHPLHHPQRWLGYVATAFILWGTSDLLWRRVHAPRRKGRAPGPIALPLLLWLTAVTGIALHVLRCTGFGLGAHYAYLAHLMVLVPLFLVELPFGEWAHALDRPLALYFEAVRARARAEILAEGGLAPARP